MTIRHLIARNIADGSGGELFAGRISISDHRIVKVEKGDFLPAEGDIFRDENCVVSPLFIDAHGHSDISLMAMSSAEGKIAQGIGAEISGNCGLSPFPLTEKNSDHLQRLYQQYGIKLDWRDHSSYMQRLQRSTAALELFPQVGHNTLRASVAGYEKAHLSNAELTQMCAVLERELLCGAVGLSFGLLYVPGCFADFNEITALMRVVARHNKICTVHLKSEGNDLENALQEMLSAARAAKLPKLHLSHLKTAGAANFHKIKHILEALQTDDLQVTGDCYCYDASMTQLSVIMPSGFDHYDDVKIMELLRDPAAYKNILQALQQERSDDYWSKVRIVSAPGVYRQFNGMLLSDAARKLALSCAKLYLEIVKLDAPGAVGAFHTLSKENMELIAAHPSVVPGSDESSRSQTFEFGSSHPRGFGNHAEYFALRRRQGADLPTVLREMSTLPAQIFALPQLGMIKAGYRALFSVIEPAIYCARATYAEPHNLAVGAEVIRV